MKTIRINNMDELQFLSINILMSWIIKHLNQLFFNLIGAKSFFLFEPSKEVFLKTVNELLECKK